MYKCEKYLRHTNTQVFVFDWFQTFARTQELLVWFHGAAEDEDDFPQPLGILNDTLDKDFLGK